MPSVCLLWVALHIQPSSLRHIIFQPSFPGTWRSNIEGTVVVLAVIPLHEGFREIILEALFLLLLCHLDNEVGKLFLSGRGISFLHLHSLHYFHSLHHSPFRALHRFRPHYAALAQHKNLYFYGSTYLSPITGVKWLQQKFLHEQNTNCAH